MQAYICKGKHKGNLVTIAQWCNDWFSTNNFNDKIFFPSSLVFTLWGIDEIKSHHNNGALFEMYEVVNVKPIQIGSDLYQLTFKKIKF